MYIYVRCLFNVYVLRDMQLRGKVDQPLELIGILKGHGPVQTHHVQAAKLFFFVDCLLCT